MRFPSIACAVALSAMPVTAALAQDYEVVQIPNLVGWPSLLPTDLNDYGHVVGIGFAGFGSMTRAFHFDGVSTHDFSAPLIATVPPEYPFVGTRALRITNHGHILLNLEVVDLGVFSYIWNGRDFVEVAPDVPPGAEPGASGINNLGVVAGSYKLIECCWTLTNRALIWDSNTGETTIIDPPAPYTDSAAYDISDTGYVAGFVMGGPLVARGYVWKDGVMTLLGTFDEDDYLSIARFANDEGAVAGFTTNSPPPGTPSLSRVMRWDAAGDVIEWAHPLGGLTAIDVGGFNNFNEVVGTMLGPQQPFHFLGTRMRNLNHHITSPVEGVVLDLWDADGINNNGQIVANGQYLGAGDFANYGFLLTPISAPGIPGDLNGDGVIDIFDLLLLLEAWGPCDSRSPGGCPADLNGDGFVNVFDLLTLLGNWG